MNSTNGFVRLSVLLLTLAVPIQALAQDTSDVDEGTIRVTLLGVGAGVEVAHTKPRISLGVWGPGSSRRMSLEIRRPCRWPFASTARCGRLRRLGRCIGASPR